MPESSRQEMLQKLRDLVQRHTVVYEVLTHEEIVRVMSEGQPASKRVKVGFDLDLYGTHDHGHTRLAPSCEHCLETFRDLQQIAEWVTSPAEPSCVSEIEAFDRALHESARRGHRFEVGLNIRIRHQHGWDQPIDEEEERCLHQIEAKLAELGVRRG